MRVFGCFFKRELLRLSLICKFRWHLNLIDAQFHCTPYSRTRCHAGVPGVHRGKIRQISDVAAVLLDPGPAGHVGNRIFVADKVASLQLVFEHTVEPFSFFRVAMDRQ